MSIIEAIKTIPSGTWKADPVHSSVGFAVKHMGVATFKGGFDAFTATLVDGKLAGSAAVSSVRVQDESLNGHLLSPDFFDDERALVLTTDFFTPIVDDPADWGRIAAANALSDVYAMGGRPLFAVNLAAWPGDGLDLAILGQVLRGGAEVAAQAGCFVAGGHTIDDPVPKYGLAVVGLAHPAALMTIDRAAPGDRLILTKAIGTGVVATALKHGKAAADVVAAAVASM